MKQTVQAPRISVNSTRLIGGVAVISAAVVALGLFREWYVASYGLDTLLEDLRQIGLDTEHSLGSWWSSLMMAGCALLMLLLGASQRMIDKRIATGWTLLAVLFLGMSLDESVSFHELMIDPLRNQFDLGGLLFFSWIIPAFLLCIGVAIYFLPFLRAIPPIYATWMIIAGGLYVAGALGMEAIGGFFADRDGNKSFGYIASTTLEESLEILALTVLSALLVNMLESDPRGYFVRFSRIPAEVPAAS